MRAFHSFTPCSAITVVVLAWLTASASCSPKINVATRFNPAVDYQQFETFSFEERELSLRPSWVDAQIKMDVKSALLSKGYVTGESSGADLLVSFQTQRNESHAPQLGRRPRKQRVRSITFAEGSLTLEIRDSFNRQIFRGVARDVVAADKGKTRQRLRAAVHELLDNFPKKE